MKSIEELWEKLGKISTNELDEIEQSFLHFPIGTHREEIWHWIEEGYNVSIYNLMFNRKKNYANKNKIL